MRLCAEGGGGSCWRQRETFPQDTKSKKEIRNKKLLYAKRMLFTWYAALPTIPCLFPLSSSLSRCESFLLSLLSTFSPLFLSFATHLKVYRCVMNRYGNKRRTLLEIWKKNGATWASSEKSNVHTRLLFWRRAQCAALYSLLVYSFCSTQCNTSKCYVLFRSFLIVCPMQIKVGNLSFVIGLKNFGKQRTCTLQNGIVTI